jgi:hypothetical protein
MQQLILLLTSFLLGSGFPAFLIGFYSIRIWESHLRSLSMSFVGSEKSRSKRRKDRERDHRRETADRLGRETATDRKLSVSTSLFSSGKEILTKSILGPKPTSVDVVSPGGQTISVSVEGVPPSTIPDVVCPLAKEVTDPSVSVPDASRLPLTNPDSAASAGRNLEVIRGLSELELLKLLGQLQEQGSAPVLPPTSGAPEEVGRSTSFQTSSVPVTGNTIRLDTTPPPGFQPRWIVQQESISGFSPAGDTGNGAISGLPPAGSTGYEGMAATSSPRGTLRFLLHSFLRVRKPEVTPRFHFRFVDPIPDMESLLLPF